LAAENGMFLRHTKGEWITIMPELLNMEWVDRLKVHYSSSDQEFCINLLSAASNSSIDSYMHFCFFQLVFEYFTERTPRSSFELRETSLLWNYKYAGIKQPSTIKLDQNELYLIACPTQHMPKIMRTEFYLNPD